MSSLVIKEYLGNNIEFKMINGEVYANATSMCKVFNNKNLSTWINSKSTQEYISALCSENNQNKDFYLDVKHGGSGHGTWIHETLVLDFCRWLNVLFAIWADKQIATLIREGSVSIKQDDKASILLAIYNGGIDAVEASRRLTAIELKPLEDKIKQDEPLVELAKKRLDKNGLLSITETNTAFNLKRGKITRWAKENGFLHKTKTEVNQAGQDYFRIYDSAGYRCIGVTESGLNFINENIENIK